MPERCYACYAVSPFNNFFTVLRHSNPMCLPYVHCVCANISDVTPTGKESRNSMWPGSQLIYGVSQTTSPHHEEQFFEHVLCKKRGVLEQTRKVQTESAKSN